MKVKLTEVSDALDFTNNEIEYHYNPDNEGMSMSNIGDYKELKLR